VRQRRKSDKLGSNRKVISYKAWPGGQLDFVTALGPVDRDTSTLPFTLAQRCLKLPLLQPRNPTDTTALFKIVHPIRLERPPRIHFLEYRLHVQFLAPHLSCRVPRIGLEIHGSTGNV